MKSRILGVIPLSFYGLVKKFQVIGKMDSDHFEMLSIIFPIKSMDTNIDSRNQKMHSYLMSEKTSTSITVTLNGPIPFDGKEYMHKGFIHIKGQATPISVKLTLEKKDDILVLKGVSLLSLVRLRVPEPSAMFASVDSAVNISLYLQIPLANKK